MSADVVATTASTRRLLTGWGRHAGSVAEVARPRSQAEVVALLRDLPERGGLARGYGRGYGDCAQDAGGLVLDMTGLAPDLSIDVESATVTASAGISIDTLIETLVPLGFFVPVTPGTRTVSVGGALAADVHGKNHHVDGSFGAAVKSLDLALPGGEVRRLTPDGDDPDAFWATIGGMGLTGVITAATFSVVPIESSRCIVDTERAADLDEALDLMMSGDDDYRYTVSWIDLMARGSSMGRSVLTRGDFATLDQLDGKAARNPLGLQVESPRGGTTVVAADGQPAHDQRLQRDVVPQGPEAAPRRDPGPAEVLPSARHGVGLEPAVRQSRLRPVPVRPSLRRGGHACARWSADSRSPASSASSPC